MEDIGDALLAPIVETVRAGVVWDNYELIQELEEPGGVVHRILVRAASLPAPDSARFFGIVADVSDPGTVPWVTTDVGERLELLIEHSPDGIIVHQEGIICYANPAALRFAGMNSLTDVLGKPMTLFIDPKDIAPVVARLSQLHEPGDAVKGAEVDIVRPDGVKFTVEVVSVRTTWGGKPAFQVIFRDVSERVRAEEAAQARSGRRAPLCRCGGRPRRRGRRRQSRRDGRRPPMTRPSVFSVSASQRGNGDEVFTGGSRRTARHRHGFPCRGAPGRRRTRPGHVHHQHGARRARRQRASPSGCR